jgi:hypothetical protein
MTTTQNNAALATAADNQATKDFVTAFQRVKPELDAIPETELEPINIDIASAVATVLGALPEIEQDLPRVAALGGVDQRLVERLGDYTAALAYAHGAYRAASGPVDPVGDLAEQIFETRDQLLADAVALARRGLLDLARVDKLKSSTGFKGAAFDVIGLVALFREHWPAISNRTGLLETELDAAAALAQHLITAVGLKEQAPIAAGAAGLVRQQAFTQFVRAYDETRRALACIHWHTGRADEIAPSLYQGRGGRKAAPNEQAPPVATTPDVPATPPTTPAVPAQPSVGKPAPSSQPFLTSEDGAESVKIGMPGSSPFLQS